MSTYRVDDGDAAVIYSKPATGGHWSKQNAGASYQNGLMLTRHRNANATLSFTGASISVYGLVSPSGTGDTQMSSYNVDGENTKTYTASPTSATQSQTLFYNSGTLSNGLHTLVLVNLVELDYLWIDYFEITTASDVDAAPAAGGTTAAAPPVSGQTTAKAASQSIQTTVVTQVFTSVIVESSTTRLSVLTTTKSKVVQGDTASTSNVNQSTQSLTSVDASQSGTSHIDAGGSTSSASKAPIGTIVGGVVGGIAVVILAIILFVLLRRRGRRANGHDLSDGMSSEAGGPASPHSPRQGDLVIPFIDVPTVASTGSSSAYSQPSTQMSGPQFEYGSFNQGRMATGYSGATYNTSTGLAAAGPTGKRQYLNANEEANASSAALLGGRQREMKQIHSTATSTSGYSDPLDPPPMAIEDLPPSYQAAAASQPSGNSVLEGLANAQKS